MIAKIKLYLILAAVLAAVGGGLYWKYQQMQKDILTLTQNNAILDTAVKTNEATIKQLEADNRRQQQTLTQLNEQFTAARETNRDLQDRLGRHDIGVLSAAKPGLTQRVLNNATKNVNRCIEILSGAPLTEAERNASNASEFNKECPWIHPNYSSSAGN